MDESRLHVALYVIRKDHHVLSPAASLTHKRVATRMYMHSRLAAAVQCKMPREAMPEACRVRPKTSSRKGPGAISSNFFSETAKRRGFTT